MNDPRPRLDIICPAFEEAEVLPHFHAALVRVVDSLQSEYAVRILYVDDGSRDGTLDLMRDWSAADPRVHYLSLSRNFGHQAALSAGLEHANGDVVITLDSDLQHPPELLPRLLEKWREGFEVVVTVRAADSRLGWFKRLSSWAFYAGVNLLSDTPMRPAAADFRLMSGRATRELVRLQESHRFLRGLVEWLGFPTAEVHYRPAPRPAGRTKYSLRKMTAFACDGIVSFSRLPLRLSLYLGIMLALVGLALGLGAATGGLASAAANNLPFLLLVALHLIGGAILCGIGVVGEYVGRIFEEVRGRPLYVLKETSNDRTTAFASRSDSAANPRRPEARHCEPWEGRWAG